MNAMIAEPENQYRYQDQRNRQDVLTPSGPVQRPDIRVLVVDDFAAYRQSLMTLITVLDGLRAVGVAADGVQALALCEVLQPEVVLMDIEMPMLDGIECSQVIKARWPRIKIIGLTGFEESDRIQEMIDAGVWGCLPKTTSSEELHQAIITAAYEYASEAAVQGS